MSHGRKRMRRGRYVSSSAFLPAAGSTATRTLLVSGWRGGSASVENRLGASTNNATEAVVRAPADGYTLLLANTANAINATLYDQCNALR
jgi:hypothetical protein